MSYTLIKMDYPTTSAKEIIGYPEGFPGQRFAAVPHEMRQMPSGPRQLGVALAGWFPDAVEHGHERPNGSPECIVIVCVRGSGWCRLRGVDHSISAGQALIIPPGVPHAYGSSVEYPWTIGWVHLTGSGTSELLTAPNGSPNPPVLTTGYLDRAAFLIGEIITYLEREITPATLTAAAGAGSHLLAVLNLGAASDLDARDPVQLSISYLASALDRPVTISQVAEAAGLSASHLSARFRRETGSSIIEYHTRLRLAQACLLLDTTTLRVRDVAFRSGYSDPYYFSRQFSAQYGLSPLSYRKGAGGVRNLHLRDAFLFGEIVPSISTIFPD